MQSDVVVVLAGGIRANGELHEGTRLRVKTAVDLFQKKIAPRLLMSGKWSLFRRTVPLLTEAEAMKRYALSLGIPEKVILKEERSSNTTSNAFYISQQFLKPQQWKKVVIVTSDYHMARTKFIFDSLLGKSYKLRYVAAPSTGNTWLQTKRWVNEKLQLFITKKYLRDFYNSDQEKITEKIKPFSELEAHPMYLFLSTVFPKNAKVFLKLFQWL